MSWLVALGLFSPGGNEAAGSDPVTCTPTKSATKAQPLDAPALAARIDQLIGARITEAGAKPAPAADESEYLRRVYLDLAGRIPKAMRVRDFLDDPAPDKRQRLVESLFSEPAYVNHFTNFWRGLLIPPNNNQQARVALGPFEQWLRDRVRENMPYNQFVRELLTAPAGGMGMGRQGMNSNAPSPVAFYQANELKPENLAGSTSRLFLGVRLECAQCHDHPHANWTRQQFWEYAAFFSGVQGPDVPGKRLLTIPGTEKSVSARFLDGKEPKWDAGVLSRAALAEWMTVTDNPYLARTAANRMWAHFFGTGICEPVDDMGEQNPPSHPELLDELARQLVLHQYDLQYLIRAITGSQAYQRTSVCSHPSQKDLHLFARMAVKGMTPEQLFDSFVEATGYEEKAEPPSPNGFPSNSLRAQFLARFSSQERPTEHHTSILQALALMNGKFIQDVTNLDRSKNLAAIVDFPAASTADRVESLFINTLSRKPRPEELSRFVNYVNTGGPRGQEAAALADVFWVLLNSAEFRFNH
jgi:hypothetical protein